MSGPYTAAERLGLETALARAEPLECPYCAVELTRQTVARPREVSYVRQRVWVLCPQCHRTAGLDVRAGGPP